MTAQLMTRKLTELLYNKNSVNQRFFATFETLEQDGNNSTLYVFDLNDKRIEHTVAVNDSVLSLTYDHTVDRLYGKLVSKQLMTTRCRFYYQ
jgi:hypothetical protein